MSDELSNATRIAALEDYNQRLLSENVRLTNEAAEVRETLDSLRQSIYAACAGSGCLNAHELRAALDASTARESAYRADVVRLTAEREEWRKINGNQSILVMLTEAELARERSRADVLAAEVKAWRHNDDIHECRHNTEYQQRQSVNAHDAACQAAQHTDSTNALDPAKFVPEPTLARNQPCGCVVCRCEDEKQCQGCGAKHCGKHEVGKLPEAKFEVKP